MLTAIALGIHLAGCAVYAAPSDDGVRFEQWRPGVGSGKLPASDINFALNVKTGNFFLIFTDTGERVDFSLSKMQPGQLPQKPTRNDLRRFALYLAVNAQDKPVFIIRDGFAKKDLYWAEIGKIKNGKRKTHS